MKARLWGLFSSGSDDISCRKFQEMASEYLDGDLGARELWRFTYHAERCGGCGVFVSSLKATLNALHSLPPRKAPDDLKRRILERYSTGHGKADSGT